MNDRRFIELLNLYLDHHISAAEAAELEAEVLANPERKRTYDDYCRMQRACCLIGKRSRSLAPASAKLSRALRDADRKIAAPRRSIWRPVYTGSFAAAAMAACVTVVVVTSRQSPSNLPAGGPGESFASAPVSQPEEPVAVAALTTPAPTPSASFEYQPVFASTGLGVIRNTREAEIASNDREALEWMQRVDMLPVARVLVDEQAFEGRPTLHTDNRVFRSRHMPQGAAEFTAYQFQR